MSRQLNVLIIAPDAELESEVRSGLRELKGVASVVHTARDDRRGVEAAGSHRPDLIVLDLDGLDLARLCAEIGEGSPRSVLVGAYRIPPGQEGISGEQIIRATRAGVRDYLRRPISSAELDALVDRVLGAAHPAARRNGRLASFVSNKGGVGKSTLAVNVACELARAYPNEVLLVDLSLQLGVCASLLDLQPDRTVVDIARQIDRLDETLLRSLVAEHDCGLHVVPAPPDAVTAAELDERVVARLLAVARRAYRHVVIDTFPVLDSVTLAILDLSDDVFVVFDGLVPTTLGTKALLGVLDEVGVPDTRRAMVLCQGHPSFLGKLRPPDVQDQLGAPIAYRVPFDKRVLPAANTGEPLVLRLPLWSSYRRAIRRLANHVAGAGLPVAEADPALDSVEAS